LLGFQLESHSLLQSRELALLSFNLHSVYYPCKTQNIFKITNHNYSRNLTFGWNTKLFISLMHDDSSKLIIQGISRLTDNFRRGNKSRVQTDFEANSYHQTLDNSTGKEWITRSGQLLPKKLWTWHLEVLWWEKKQLFSFNVFKVI